MFSGQAIASHSLIPVEAYLKPDALKGTDFL